MSFLDDIDKDLLKSEIEDLLRASLDRLGKEAINQKDVLAEHVVNRAQALAHVVGEPGFDLAVEAEARTLAMMAGLSLVEGAEVADAEFKGIMYGALRIAVVIAAAAL